MTQYAILLIKPDAFYKQLVSEIHELVRSSGLTIRCRHELMMSADTVQKAFPEAKAQFPVERILLELQYDGQPTELIAVSSDDAIRDALELRALIREKWSTGPFANVIHAASSVAECGHQLAVLAHGCATCRTICDGLAQSYTPDTMDLTLPGSFTDGRWLRDYLAELWRDPSSPVWRYGMTAAHQLSDLATADDQAAPRYQVALINNSPRATADSITAAIATAVPTMSMTEAVRHMLESSHIEEHTLAVGSRAQSAAVRARLTELGFQASMTSLR